jgi:putative ABC transport system permease protein
MSLAQSLATGLRAVAAQRLRSLLTALGILIGVTAVIMTVGIGLGARQSITNRITALGTNLITVTPGSVRTGGVSSGLGGATTLTVSDAEALNDHSVAPDAIAVAPVVQRSAGMVAGAQNWTAPVTGSTPGWLVASNRTVTTGHFLTDADVTGQTQVAVLGATTAQRLFPDGSAVGRVVTILGHPFTVIGVLNVVGGQGFNNPDDQAVVPLTTAQTELITGGSMTSVQRILVSASSRDAIGAAYQEVDSLLLQTHHIRNPFDADFSITTQDTILSTVDSVTGALTALLAGVAGISLLVGGIGVMNIMLVSVTERIAEIGLRKALGARRGDILRQFLIEAATLSAAGGLLGVVLGLVLTVALRTLTPLPAVFSPAAALSGVVIAAAIGVGFGVFPALRAARLAPIEALRAA